MNADYRFKELTPNDESHLFFLLLLGGAGGKGTWGKLGCELELPWVDPNDPNYESDGEEDLAKTDLQTLVPEMSEEDVRKAVEPLILEYFENNDTMEVLFTLQVMNSFFFVNHFWYQCFSNRYNIVRFHVRVLFAKVWDFEDLG